MFFDWTYLVIVFPFVILAMWAQAKVQTTYAKYSTFKSVRAMTAETAVRRILDANGLNHITITRVQGNLTDHYDPRSKTVNLSDSVYNSNSVAAAAVAAHECGHALQHALESAPLQMRSALVPIVSFSSRWVTWILLGGILLLETFPSLLLVGIILYGLTTLFSFVTLPVEINASTRAIAWLEQAGITNSETTPMAATALRSAAYTYVVAALASLGTLIYYISIFLGGRRN